MRLIGAKLLCLCGILALSCSIAWPAARQNHSTWTTASVLREMDSGAKDFRSLSADVERTKVTVVVNDKSTETGTIRVRGDKMLLEMNAPDAKTILRTGDNFYLYTPGLKR